MTAGQTFDNARFPLGRMAQAGGDRGAPRVPRLPPPRATSAARCSTSTAPCTSASAEVSAPGRAARVRGGERGDNPPRFPPAPEPEGRRGRPAIFLLPHIPPGARDDRRNDHGRRLAVLDRSGRHVHGRGRPPSGRRPRHPTSSSPTTPSTTGMPPSRGSGRSSVSRPASPCGGSTRSRWARPSRPTRSLERNGDRTLLVVNRGFRDALRIGYQTRPRLFDLRIVLPEMLYERVVEVDARVGAGR